MNFLLWLALIGWSLISIALHLAPSPGSWGSWAEPVSRIYSADAVFYQHMAHVFLMAGFSFLMALKLRVKVSLGKALLLTFITSLCFALLMEYWQGMLPCRFRRDADLKDLIPALIGSGLGALVGGYLGGVKLFFLKSKKI